MLLMTGDKTLVNKIINWEKLFHHEHINVNLVLLVVLCSLFHLNVFCFYLVRQFLWGLTPFIILCKWTSFTFCMFGIFFLSYKHIKSSENYCSNKTFIRISQTYLEAILSTRIWTQMPQPATWKLNDTAQSLPMPRLSCTIYGIVLVAGLQAI